MTVPPDAGGGMQSGLTLIFNGEIYNYRELRAELAACGHRFTTETDSEVLLHLYERDGLEMLGRLNGIFAFAIHDARPAGRPAGVMRGALFIARDQLGVKPLYYAQTPRGFLFGSEIKALLCDPILSREIDPLALHYTLAYLWTPAPRTVLASVRKLEPGCALLVHGGRVQRQWRYYDLPCDGTRTDRGLAESARELADTSGDGGSPAAGERRAGRRIPLRRARLQRGRRDDASGVAGAAHHLLHHRLSGRSETWRAVRADLPYARQVARHLGVDLVEVLMQPAEIQRLAAHGGAAGRAAGRPGADQRAADRRTGPPDGDPGAVVRRRRRRSVRRLSPPLGAHTRAPLGLAAAVPARRAAGAGVRFCQRSGLGQANHALRRLAKMLAYAGEEPDRRLVSYFWWSTERLRRGLYSAEFAARVRETDTAAPLLESLAHIPAESDRLQRLLYLETKHFLADHNLNYTDRAGMAAGVEVRVPILDIDLVRFSTRLPAHYKQRGRVGKAVFKLAMEPYLPRQVIYRPKTGFGAPLRRWLRQELRPLVEETLSASALQRRGILRSGRRAAPARGRPCGAGWTAPIRYSR